MALPPIEENEAGWLTAISFAGFALWKLWLRVRQDDRGDKAAAREHAAEGDVIAVLREEVQRLADGVRDLGEQIEEERRLRFTAEQRAAQLQMRVETLERRLRSLGQTP